MNLRKKDWRIILTITIMSLLVFFSKIGLSKQNYEVAPDFKIEDLDGKIHTLNDYRGKILLINFWATWCPPCRAEIPDFIEVYEAEKNNGLAILGLSVDDLSTNELQTFVRRFKINYPVALATQEIIRQFRPGQYIPTTIFIDKKGQIRHKHVGLLDKKTLLDYFRKLKAED